MKIKLGMFDIESDSRQFIVTKERPKGSFPGKEDPKEGETTSDVIGYYSTFEACLKSIPTKALLRSDANCLDDAIRIIREYRGIVSSALKGA